MSIGILLVTHDIRLARYLAAHPECRDTTLRLDYADGLRIL